MIKIHPIHILINLVYVTALYSQEVMPPVTIHDTADIVSIPIYPRIATFSGQFGEVVVSIKITPNGHCKAINIHGESISLVQGVRKALTGWRFLPRKYSYVMNVTFNFILLPPNANDSELVSEIFPKLNKIIIKSRRPNFEKHVIFNPLPLPNQ